MKAVLCFIGGAVAPLALACVAGMIYLKTGAHGFSAKAKPSFLETLAATNARDFTVPSEMKSRTDPVPNSPEVIAQAKAHWADHCATCHGNDGKGKTEMESTCIRLHRT